MTDAEYLETQHEIMMVGLRIEKLDMNTFLERIVESQAFAPLLDPALYLKASDNLKMIESLATDLKNFKITFTRLQVDGLANILRYYDENTKKD